MVPPPPMLTDEHAWTCLEGGVRTSISARLVGASVASTMQHIGANVAEEKPSSKSPTADEEAKTLKGSRWLWVKNWENLSEQERAELEQLKGRFPLLRQLAEQREGLRAIFEDKKVTTAAEGRNRLQGWMAEAAKLGLKALERFCKTLTNWMDKIANYFVTRSSNGRTEGFNHGLRSIRRQ